MPASVPLSRAMSPQVAEELTKIMVSVVDNGTATNAQISGVQVVGESSDSEETTAMILNRKPDIAILNSSLRDGSGIEVLQHIKRLMVPPTIIVVTDDPSRGNKTCCSLAGADFIFEKAREDHKIVSTVGLLCIPHNQTQSLDSPVAMLDE